MPIFNVSDIGVYIAEERHKLGLTQAQLAAAIGVSRFWVIRAERGEPRIELDLVLRALRFLGTSLRAVPAN